MHIGSAIKASVCPIRQKTVCFCVFSSTDYPALGYVIRPIILLGAAKDRLPAVRLNRQLVNLIVKKRD